MVKTKRRKSIPRKTVSSTSTKKAKKNQQNSDVGNNFVSGGIEENGPLFALAVCGPFLTILLGYITSQKFYNTGTEPFLSTMIPACISDISSCGSSVLNAGLSDFPPTMNAVKFICGFMVVAFFLEFLPGQIETGPETLTGHVPKYVDNGMLHCLTFSALFWGGSNLGPGKYYDFGIIYDVFPSAIVFLNIFGLLFCVFLTYKGLHFPSTADSGSSGSKVKDFLWGTELYPRLGWWDLKRFINCRFSMTFWQLAGLSFFYKSYTVHNKIDYGLLFSAISQYVYLFKFFLWEMGYMRSIDIIVDRAGFEIQWGCLCFVPAVYTLCTRFCVMRPSGLEFPVASCIFVISLVSIALNYASDREREVFRATNGKTLVWGRKPEIIKAEYVSVDPKTGKRSKKKSLLLASGFWGQARHLQYLFELMAAWSWCFLANPFVNGVIPMFYAFFLTYLLIDRANRDSKKCHLKYGKYYEEYVRRVPYKIIPGIY
jgi:7-dehydrocholesterol reductase